MLEKAISSTLENIDKRDFWIKNKIFFFKELGYLLQGWVGLLDAITLINQNTSNFALKAITRDIRKHITQGKTLAYSLTRQAEYFSSSDIAIIKSGEKSGHLVQTLQSLAHEYQFINKIYNQYMGALIYPIILIVIAVGAVIALFAFVLPAIFSITEQFEWLELPTMTRILKNISEIIIGQWQWLVWWTIFVIFACAIWFSTQQGSKFFYRSILQIPVIGKITQYYYVIKMCRYLTMMLTSGMNYVQSFKLLKEIMDMPLYEEMIEKILTGIQQWKSIYDDMKYETELIPMSATALIKVGEETANMEESLNNISEIFDEELQSTITNLSKVIEPVMLVFIWWIIIVIALGVFGVITNIMDSIQL